MDEDIPPPSRRVRVRRPSSSIITSTTSPVFPAPLPNPGSHAHHSRSRPNLNNNNLHHGDIDDDIPSSSISSSTSSFTPPSPRPTRQNSHNLSSSNAASSSRNSGPVSPLDHDPDSTFSDFRSRLDWGPVPSPNNNYRASGGPPTPGGLCVVSSSTFGDIDDVPTMDDINDGVSGSNIVMLPCSVSSGSNSNQSNNNSGGPSTSTTNNNNNNGLILSNANVNLNHNHVHSMEPAASSSSSNLSHSNQSNDLNFSLLPLRSKIKKASSFERFSLQAASNSMSSSISSATTTGNSSSSTTTSNTTTTNNNQQQQQQNSTETTNDLPVNQQQQQQHEDLASSSSSSSSSRLLWDSIQSSSTSSSSISNSRQFFMPNSSGGMSDESKSLRIKIPYSKKWAAKIAMLDQEQQNALSAMSMNLMSEGHGEGGENLTNGSNLINDGGPIVTAESLIRELSESPLNLNLAESHSHSNNNNSNNTHDQSNHSANSQLRRNFMTTTVTTTAMTLPLSSKKILTPKQKMLHRVQSGEILQPQSMSSSSSSSLSSSTIVVNNNNFQQQQSLSLVPTDNSLDQQVHSPPPQLPPQLDVYSYETLPRDDFVVVQDSLSSLSSKVDGDPNNVSVLYDPDAYSYYYGNMLGDEIFSTTSSSTSRGPLFMVPASSSTMALQDAVDSLQLQGQHGHVEFILNSMDEGHDHDNERGRGDELDGGAAQQAFLDPNEGHSSMKNQSQADSTLRNLLMMEPIRTHDDSWISAGYQSRLLTSRSIGGGGINTGSGNMNVNQMQNSSINAAMNHLNNSWMNLNSVNSWTHSMGMNLARDEQEEVMDMSVMDSPEKHGSGMKRGHIVVHESDVDLVSMQIPMDLQQPLDLIGSTQNSNKGGQLLIHDNGGGVGGGSMNDPHDSGNNNPINLQQHHRCSNVNIVDDDEPVNLMSAVNLENDIGQQQQSYHPHHHHHHHHHYQSSSSSRQLQQQQMMQTETEEDETDHLIPINVPMKQNSSSSVIHSSRHLGHALDSQMSCNGGYITVHQVQSSNDNSNSSTGQLQDQINNTNNNNDSSPDTVITINHNNNNNNNSNNNHDSNDNSLDNSMSDERRIIRVKKKELNLMSSGSLALSPGGSMLDGTLTLSKSPVSTATATFILDKPVQPKSFASLPSPLTLIRLTGNTNDWAIFTSRYKTIAVNTRFGPVEGPLKKAEDLSNKNAVYPCLVMLDNSNNLWQLDRVDDELCNWMKFVRLARKPSEQNAVISEDRGLLYFSTTKEIPPKTELQVGYSFEYATKYGLELKYADDEDGDLHAQGTEHETDCDLLNQQSIESHNKQILDDSTTTQRDKVSLSLPTGSDQDGGSSKDRVIEDGNVDSSYVVVETFPCFECTSEFPSMEQLNIHLDTEHQEPEVVVVPRRPKKKFNKKSKAFVPLTPQNENSSKINNDNQSNNNNSQSVSPNHSDEFDNNCINNNNNTVNNVVDITHDRDDEMDTVCDADSVQIISTEPEVGIKRGKYECQSCGISVSTLVELKKHSEEHYDGIFMDNNVRTPKTLYKKPVGDLVGSSMETNTFKSPIKNLADGTNSKQEFGVKVKCTMCYKSFKSKDRLQTHMIVHNDEDTKPLKCQFCPKRFLTNSALAGHIKTHAEQGKSFECPMCNFVTQQLLQLKEHVQTHKNKENGLFYCPRCSKKFTIYSMVRKHIRAFHGARQFSCDYSNCSMSFPTSDKLKLHKLKHSDHREFLCAECGRQFKRKDKLREHMKRMHENRKKVLEIQGLHGALSSSRKNSKKFMPKVSPEEFEKFVYKCADCMMGFKRRGMLVNHLAKRHPEKPPQQVPELNLPILRPTRNYFCPYCEKTYKSSSKRKSHILKAHPGKAVPPQLKGKEILTMTLSDKLENSNVRERTIHSSSVNEHGKLKDSTATLSTLSSDQKNDHVDSSVQPFSEVEVVGKVMTDFHSCQWCHRQYATRAKLLQHQRKSHLHLMPPDMQLPRTQKNNVLQRSLAEGRGSNISNSTDNDLTEVIVEVESQNQMPSSSITVAFAPDSSTQIGSNNSISSSTTAEGQQTITLNDQQHQLQQIHISAEEGNVIGFLLTTTVNGDSESEIVMVPVPVQQQTSQQIISAASNVIQQAVLGESIIT